MEIDLTGFELFKSFAEIEFGKLYIDLHNDFSCQSINISNISETFALSFNTEKLFDNKVKRVEIVFRDVVIESLNFKVEEINYDDLILDIIYRGRFEHSDGFLEESLNGKFYYYITFLDDYSIELFSSSVIANIIFE